LSLHRVPIKEPLNLTLLLFFFNSHDKVVGNANQCFWALVNDMNKKII